jgi:hypothetical protein
MTPDERKLIDDLFGRLASLETAPRDADGVRAINDGLQRAPNALYPLVQTALVQDEALKRADARIRELENELGVESGEPAKQPGFLDSMRDALTGRPHGSVPSVRASAPGASASPWGNTGGGMAQPGNAYAAPVQAPGVGGGSFLGTAAATVAGVVGGALLMNSFRGMFGGGHNYGALDSSGGAPWGSGGGNSDMARDAGVNDIGGGGRGDDGGSSERAGLFDQSGDDSGDGGFDAGGDFGGGDGGSDSA